MNTPIIIFSDLDKTLFHSSNYKDRFKLAALKEHKNGKLGSYSYMSEAQSLLFDLLNNNKNVTFIPVTARNESQFKRTFLFRDNIVNNYIYGFTNLHIDNKPECEFNNNINFKIRKLDKFLDYLYSEINNKFNVLKEFKIRRNTNFIQIVFNSNNLYKKELILFINNLIKEEKRLEYAVSGKNIYIKPRILDKKEPVKYIIEKYKPKLTIGIGDDILDHNFMSLTDFKLLPNNSSYVEKLNYLLKI